MSSRDPESLKALCKELARKLGTNPNRHLLEMTLRHGGYLRRAAAEPRQGPEQPPLLREPAPPVREPAREPRSISIWQPRMIDGELTFVRPAPGSLGDGFSHRAAIRQRKTARRVCLLGESVALGFLYAPHLTPAQVLERQLNAIAGPGTYEVVDLSKSSESMLPLATTLDSALQLEPDAFVVFFGNNWNFQEADASPYIPVPSFRTRYAKALREGGIAGVRRLGAALLEDKARHAMARIAELAAARSIPVVVVVPEVNLADWETRQPVAWRSGDDTARWHALFDDAVRSLAAGDFTSAIAAAEQMLQLDEGTSPSAFRILATAHRALGRADDAARAARAEVDADLLPTMCYLHCPQATTHIQELLRRACDRHGFTAVDLPSVFAAHAGSALPGRRYFLDYCHLTAEGIHVAMAATASALLQREGAASELTWQRILEDAPAMTAPPRAEAVARLGAAIHTAHRMQAISAKHELLVHWCDQALAASPEVAEAMFDVIELRCSPCPPLLSRAARRNFASDHPLMFQHGLEWPNLDAELIEAMCCALEQRGVPARERVTRMLIDRFAVDRAPADLAAAFFRWDLYEAFFADSLNLDHARHRAAVRAAQPASSFCLVAEGERDLELAIHARLPEIDGAEARRGTVSIELGGQLVGELACGPAWSDARVRIPVAALRPGLNKLSLRWPPPPPAGDAALRSAVDRLERGLAADIHPVFGEVFSLVARRWPEPPDPAP